MNQGLCIGLLQIWECWSVAN